MAVVVAAGSGSGATAVRTVALTVGFGTVLLVFGRKLLRRYADAPGVLLGGLVLAGAATAAIGITPVFGAFAYGLVCPPSPAAATLTDRLERTVAEPLLPFFFLGTGLVTDICVAASARISCWWRWRYWSWRWPARPPGRTSWPGRPDSAILMHCGWPPCSTPAGSRSWSCWTLA